MDCTFCNPRVLKSDSIWETETEYVIYNLRKTNKGRCLVIPKRHVENIRELNKKEVENLFKTVQHVSTVLNKNLKPIGINYGFNEGEYAGQMVQHFHFHILPRYKNDKVLTYHLFHGDPKTKSDHSREEMEVLVSEFRKFFKHS